MEKAEQTMLDNLAKNSGKTLEEWIAVIKDKQFVKHGEIMKFLKGEHSFTHGFANMVALKARKADAGSVKNTDDLVVAQFKGKEHLKVIYDVLLDAANALGNDVAIAPKKAYVSLRRKKQFATLRPASKTRFEIGLNIKEQESEGKLEKIDKPNSMCSHQINISAEETPDNEVLNWLKVAYEQAG
jgi:predicted transport protein